MLRVVFVTTVVVPGGRTMVGAAEGGMMTVLMLTTNAADDDMVGASVIDIVTVEVEDPPSGVEAQTMPFDAPGVTGGTSTERRVELSTPRPVGLAGAKPML